VFAFLRHEAQAIVPGSGKGRAKNTQSEGDNSLVAILTATVADSGAFASAAHLALGCATTRGVSMDIAFKCERWRTRILLWMKLGRGWLSRVPSVWPECNGAYSYSSSDCHE